VEKRTFAICVGIAVNTAKANEPVQIATFGNTITASSGTPLAVGRVYVLMALTAGAIVPDTDFGTDPTTGDYVTVVGIATSTTALFICPVASGVARAA
jgi:hypothetical protein